MCIMNAGGETHKAFGNDVVFKLKMSFYIAPLFHWLYSYHFFSLSISQITAFDELQADFKVPIDQGNPLHAVGFLCLFIFFLLRHTSPTMSWHPCASSNDAFHLTPQYF